MVVFSILIFFPTLLPVTHSEGVGSFFCLILLLFMLALHSHSCFLLTSLRWHRAYTLDLLDTFGIWFCCHADFVLNRIASPPFLASAYGFHHILPHSILPDNRIACILLLSRQFFLHSFHMHHSAC